MKQTTRFLLALLFVSLGSNVFADSLVINYSNNKRLYKWDGTNISNYSNNKKLYKLNGNTVSVYSTNKKLIKVDGLIPIPILIVLVAGLL